MINPPYIPKKLAQSSIKNFKEKKKRNITFSGLETKELHLPILMQLAIAESVIAENAKT